jgi:tRNA (adenine57-N1/adenine58-N1)-methyltransferase catalytic subunit
MVVSTPLNSTSLGLPRPGKNDSYSMRDPSARFRSSEEFMQHGMSEYVILQHRNVCKDGFDLQDEIDCGKSEAVTPSIKCRFRLTYLITPLNIARPVFLDLPAPWDAISHVKRAARVRPIHPSSAALLFTASQKDRIVRICCFSPCIEQVLRTVSALNEHGYTGTYITPPFLIRSN